MANQYATIPEAVARNPSLGTFDVVELDNVLTAASRWIDGYCGRKFWLDPAVTDRVFKACDSYVLNLGEHEIGSTSGVIVKVDDGGGTFATTLPASAYQLEPVNAPYSAVGAKPYTVLRALSNVWPIPFNEGERQELVKVTAKYGWPTVPAAVREACLALTINDVENPTGVRSEAIDGYSVSYSGVTDASPVGKAIQRLDPFRRMWAA